MTAPVSPRHFLDLDQLAPDLLRRLIALAKDIKARPKDYRVLDGETLALIFEKPSTRTRVSFEVGMRELGGQVTTLTGSEIQLGRGETIGDTARVLSRYVSAIMLRTFEHDKLTEMAKSASVPVINGLTNATHPCQVMADLMTLEERLGNLTGKRFAWVGDGDNNILSSLIHASTAFGFHLSVASPPDFLPPAALVAAANAKGPKVAVMQNPMDAADGADAIFTDCWVSMHNTDAAARIAQLAPYQVNDTLMSAAAPDAVFLHCLPAHRGEEVTDSVIDGPKSAVWDEAENRKHAQKAVLLWCLGKVD
jgi:ornithine carbamoyltransferase